MTWFEAFICLSDERDALRAQVEELTLRRDETVAMCTQLEGERGALRAQLAADTAMMPTKVRNAISNYYTNCCNERLAFERRVRVLEEALRTLLSEYNQVPLGFRNRNHGILAQARAALTPEEPSLP